MTLHTRPGCHHRPCHHRPSDSDPQIKGTQALPLQHAGLQWAPAAPDLEPFPWPPPNPGQHHCSQEAVWGHVEKPVLDSSCPVMTMCWAAFLESQLFGQCNLVHNGLSGLPDGTNTVDLPQCSLNCCAGDIAKRVMVHRLGGTSHSY